MQIRTDFQQANKIKELIKKQCANYIDGQCILLDTNCPQMGCMYSVLCKYFINSVLPLDKKLYKELLPDAEETSGLYINNVKYAISNSQQIKKMSNTARNVRTKLKRKKQN